jgi:NAD(P)-dependent dehydrogenase (short-subunit alcohol dehydrogenase family)
METVALIEEAGGCGLAVPTDVTDQQAVERMVTETVKNLGPVDLLVNNAGVPGPPGPIWQVDPKLWWQCIDVNLRGQFLCSRTVLSSMIAHCQGRIINVSSAAGLQAVPYASAYAISKAAVIHFTENLASETKAYGISVFTLYPGEVRTAMTEYMSESEEGQRWVPWVREMFEAKLDVPPEHAAHLAVFLASGKADSLTGCFISVRDDINMMVQRAEEIQEKRLYKLRLRT